MPKTKEKVAWYNVALDTCPTITVEATSVEEAVQKAEAEYDKMSDRDKLELLGSGLEIGSFVSREDEP